MPEIHRYFVEIARHGEHYHGRVHQGDAAAARELPELQLGADTTIDIKNVPYALGALVEALIGFQDDDLRKAYDERGQLEIGRHLYSQIFHCLEPRERQRLRDARVDIRIVTEDEHIARLPWVLLAEGGSFLATEGWSVSLGRRVTHVVCELPPSPRMLIVAPQPDGLPRTQADDHIAHLEQRLSPVDPRHVRGQHLQVVTTWEAFLQAIDATPPDIIYYYGHGVGDAQRSLLRFASEEQAGPVDIPILDMAACIRQQPRKPRLVYLNCCQGNTGGLLGAGQVFGEDIPAVVSNRTVALIDAAQAQGIAFWHGVLVEGRAPHDAMAAMRTNLAGSRLSLGDVRWMTPVLHCHYGAWHFQPPKPRNRLEIDPHWRLKLDRTTQFSIVFFRTHQMLQEQTPRAYAYIWYGQRGQGVGLFHQRLEVQLRGGLPHQVHFYQVRPEWPSALDNPYAAFEVMLTNAFDVNTLDAIPARIRTASRSVSGRQTLVYVCHTPVLSSKVFDTTHLKAYLTWWEQYVVPLFEGPVFALLGVSFVVRKPGAFYKRLMQREHILEVPSTAKMVIKDLDEMGDIRPADLLEFFQTHAVPLAPEHRDRVIEDIMTRSGGQYDLALEELKAYNARDWAPPVSTDAAAAVDDDDDYD